MYTKTIMAVFFCLGMLPGYSQDEVPQLSPETFRQRLDTAREEVVLVDVRTDEEVREGVIPGAIQVNVLAPDFKEQVSRLDRNKTYLVYCKTGIRGNRAATTMQAMGFKNLYNLDGGITAWKKKGFPVKKPGRKK